MKTKKTEVLNPYIAKLGLTLALTAAMIGAGLYGPLAETLAIMVYTPAVWLTWCAE